jgi:hypothetical protein
MLFPVRFTAEAATTMVPDALRYVVMFDESEYADGVKDAVAHMREAGLELVKLHNTFAEGETHKCVTLQLRHAAAPSDDEAQGHALLAEIPFHTPHSYRAKIMNERDRQTEQQLPGAADGTATTAAGAQWQDSRPGGCPRNQSGARGRAEEACR